jgi:hypothetical protein
MQNGHTGSRKSTDYYGSRSAISILIYLSVLMAGLTWTPIELMFRFMGVVGGTASSIFAYQWLAQQGVQHYFGRKATLLLNSIKANVSQLILVIDTRYDTPG